MNIAQNVKSALAPVGLAGLVLLATACGTPTPTAPTPTLQIDNGIPYFGFRRPNGDYETLTINPAMKPGMEAIATLVGPSPAKSFYTVWGTCSGFPSEVGPMGGDHTIVGVADYVGRKQPIVVYPPPKGQEGLYQSLQDRFVQIVRASGVRPDCSYQSQR